MKWAHFLHIYQPADQHPGILEKIVNESYRPLFKGLYKIPNTKVTLNVNATLTERLFENGYRDVLDDIKNLVEMGRLELTGSAKYHAFLPLIPETEVRRQIELNYETNKRYLGEAFNPKGFFSPEMGYSPKVAALVKDLGYEWMLADEVSLMGNKGDMPDMSSMDTVYEIDGIGLQIYFREKRPSNLIMGALVRSPESLKKALGDRVKKDTYILTAMDGETLGHHRPGLEVSYFDIIKDPQMESVFISELPSYFKKVSKVKPLDSSWATSQQDIEDGNPFVYWFDKGNKIHEYQWELAAIAIRAVSDSEFSDEKYPMMLEETKAWEEMTENERSNEERKRAWVKARDMLDKALNSDPWWWACAKPWWSVEMIEKGMHALYMVVVQIPDSSPEDRSGAEDLYKRILMLAHDWQRKGMVDKMAENERAERKIPLSKRFAAGDHYKALMNALRDEEDASVDRREYEQAIKWRDSQYKLERDLDVYDAIHVMDLFREEGNFGKFQEYLKEYQEKYKKISKGQPE